MCCRQRSQREEHGSGRGVGTMGPNDGEWTGLAVKHHERW